MLMIGVTDNGNLARVCWLKCPLSFFFRVLNEAEHLNQPQSCTAMIYG